MSLMRFLVLFGFLLVLYHQHFIFGKIPFPGDLLVNSYSPWFDYYHFPVKNPEISDVFSQIYLWKKLAIDSLAGGQWPLWNPYSLTGTPLLANFQSASFYPLNILLLLPWGWGLFIFSQTLLALVFMYLLLGCWVKSFPARLLGSLTFAIGGLMSTWLELGTPVHAFIWLPLTFFAIENFFRRRQIRYLIILEFALSASILAGHAQLATITLLLSAIFGLFKALVSREKLWLTLPALALCAIGGIGLAALQLLPSFELLQRSIRLSDNFIADQNYGLLPLGNIFKFFASDVFGNSAKLNFWGFLNYTETSSFMGTLSLPLFLLFLKIKKKSAIEIFFIGLFFLSLILAFDNPISELIYTARIPLFTLSYASRWLFVAGFALSGLISFALDRFSLNPDLQKDFGKRLRYSLATVLGISLGFVIVYLQVKNITSSASTRIEKEVFRLSSDYSLQNFIVSLRNLVYPLAILGLVNLLILLRPLRKILPWLLVLITFVDLSFYFFKITPFVPKELIFPSTPTLEFLKVNTGHFRVGREHAEVLPPNTWMAYGLSSFEGYDPLYSSQYGRFIHFLNSGDLSQEIGSGRYAELSSKYSSPFLDSLGVKYFLAIFRDDNNQVGGKNLNNKFKDTPYKIVFSDKSSAVLENPKALERAYFAKSFQVLADKEAMLTLSDPTFNPANLTVLSESLNIATVSGQGAVTIEKYAPNQVNLQSKTSSEQILVLSDQYDNGWQAKIDDSDTPIVKANFNFRAIRVPEGTHQIIFQYNPASFKLGLLISLFSLILTMLLSGAGILLKRF